MKFGEKYKSLIRHSGRFDILEGTTYSGKTTVGFGVKYMLEVAKSQKKYHAIAGKDLSTVEKNIINSDRGLLKVWGDNVMYNGRGTGDIKQPHIVFGQGSDTKIIYVFGYDDRARWTKILGGQLGCLGVDEANIADIDFVQESSIRQDYMLWTLNPDNPDLDIYERYINHSRPLPQYVGDYPQELLSQLDKPHKEGYTHWYFTFDDNVACTDEKKTQIISNAPAGSKLYKNKILGLRGVGEGSLYSIYMSSDLIIPYEDIDTNALQEVIASIDMGTATGDNDSKAHTVVSIVGFSKEYRHCIVLEAKVIPSINLSQVIQVVDDLLIPYWATYYSKLSKIVIDCAGSGELLRNTWDNLSRLKSVKKKQVRKTGKVGGNKGEITLVTRAQLKCQLLMHKVLYWSDRAVDSYNAHQNILSAPDGSELEQSNTANDYADSLTYALTENWAQMSNIKRKI